MKRRNKELNYGVKENLADIESLPELLKLVNKNLANLDFNTFDYQSIKTIERKLKNSKQNFDYFLKILNKLKQSKKLNCFKKKEIRGKSKYKNQDYATKIINTREKKKRKNTHNILKQKKKLQKEIAALKQKIVDHLSCHQPSLPSDSSSSSTFYNESIYSFEEREQPSNEISPLLSPSSSEMGNKFTHICSYNHSFKNQIEIDNYLSQKCDLLETHEVIQKVKFMVGMRDPNEQKNELSSIFKEEEESDSFDHLISSPRKIEAPPPTWIKREEKIKKSLAVSNVKIKPEDIPFTIKKNMSSQREKSKQKTLQKLKVIEERLNSLKFMVDRDKIENKDVDNSERENVDPNDKQNLKKNQKEDNLLFSQIDGFTQTTLGNEQFDKILSMNKMKNTSLNKENIQKNSRSSADFHHLSFGKKSSMIKHSALDSIYQPENHLSFVKNEKESIQNHSPEPGEIKVRKMMQPETTRSFFVKQLNNYRYEGKIEEEPEFEIEVEKNNFDIVTKRTENSFGHFYKEDIFEKKENISELREERGRQILDTFLTFSHSNNTHYSTNKFVEKLKEKQYSSNSDGDENQEYIPSYRKSQKKIRQEESNNQVETPSRKDYGKVVQSPNNLVQELEFVKVDLKNLRSLTDYENYPGLREQPEFLCDISKRHNSPVKKPSPRKNINQVSLNDMAVWRRVQDIKCKSEETSESEVQIVKNSYRRDNQYYIIEIED